MKKLLVFMLLVVVNSLTAQNNPKKGTIDNRAVYSKKQFITYTVPISHNTTTDIYGWPNGEINNISNKELEIAKSNRLSDKNRKELVETIFSKIKSGQVTAYDISFWSDCGWNRGPANGFIDCPTEKIDGTFAESYLQYEVTIDSLDDEGYPEIDDNGDYIRIDKRMNYEVDDISSLTFYENWYFDIDLKNKKPLKKEVLGYSINVLNRNPETLEVVGIRPLLYIKCKDIKEKKMNPIAENYISSTEIRKPFRLKLDFYDYSWFNNNLTMDFGDYFLSSITNLCQKPEIYLSKWNIEGFYNNDKGEFPFLEKLSNKEIISKFGSSYEVKKYDENDEVVYDKYGEIIYETVFESFSYRDIISLGFVENWYFDSETLSISKNVKGFMPSVHSFNPYTYEINGLKEIFYIKF